MHKLRSIYDALDMGQNQQALKQCNQILKKKPDMPVVKALKALSLVRTGSVAEGLALCRSIQNGTPPPTEESILNAMLLVYKQTGNLEEMCKCYEAAWQVDPKNEELAVGVFFSYVRVSNFAKQQQIALKLFKQFPKDAYYMWAVVSTYLQGQLNNNPPLSQLAEKMMDKVVTENKIKTSETLLFYIYMLSQSGKYEKVIELLSGQLGVTLLNDAIPGERIHMQAKLLTKTNKIEEASKLYYERIKEDPDDWAAYTGYLDSLFEIKKAQQKDSSSESREFFRSFQNLPKQIRGPFLAEIDLESRLFALGEQKVDVIVELLSKYFERFGAKACCVYDIKAYLKHVPQDSRQAFVDRLRALVPPQPHTTTVPIQQSITIHQISRMLGLHQKLTKEGKVSLVRTLLSEYTAAIPVGSQREPSERIVGDDLVLLIVHILEDLGSEEGRVQRLCEAAALLEWARTVSKTNFQFLLHLIDIYKKLEAYKPIATIWPLLSIRYIQLDTLLHVVLDDAIQLGFHQQIIPVLEQFWKFHDQFGGTPDSIVQAYSHHSFSKVKEFLDFKSRLERSHQLAIAKTERIFISLYTGDSTLLRAGTILQSTNAQEVSATDDNFLQNLSSNQDVHSIDRWDPLDQERAPFPRERKLAELKQRRLILVMLTSITTDNATQFQAAHSAFTSATPTTTANDIHSVISRSTLALFDAHSSFLSANSQEQEEKTFRDKVDILRSSLQEAQEHIKSTLNQTSPPRIAAFYRFGVELLYWVSLVVQGWAELYKKKGKKDKKEWVKSALEPFITALHDLDTTLASLPFNYQVPEHTDIFGDTPHKELQLGTVSLEINASHKQSHATLTTIIATRAKVLSAIKL